MLAHACGGWSSSGYVPGRVVLRCASCSSNRSTENTTLGIVVKQSVPFSYGVQTEDSVHIEDVPIS